MVIDLVPFTLSLNLCVLHPGRAYWCNDLSMSFLRKSFLYTPEEVFNVLPLLSGI